MKLLMIGHLLGDFYFQTNVLAEKKKKSFRYTALHSTIYGIVMFVILAFLICGKPAAIIVSLVFGLIPKTTGITEINNESIVGIKKESVRIGSWIGILEREIILILGLLGQYGAIGFVIAAKSLARHSQLNDPVFAEKYLIGTLLSSFMALLCVMMCKVL